MRSDRVLVIGAGPFGLSISAHLHGLGVEHWVVGRPLDTWRAHMPPGTKLRSEPYGSDMSSPRSGYDVAGHARRFGLDYVERLGPLSIERFLEYGDWFTGELVPEVDDHTVTEVSATDDGFRVAFADADPATAEQVVVATGVLPYAVMPSELAGLPPSLASHTRDHGDATLFRGRRVAVVGGGQSATETAALMHEGGAEVTLVARRPAINWLTPNPATVNGFERLRRPVNKLCEGWHCALWNSPAAFRRLPRDVRIDKARSVLGPAGAWWLKDRVDGVIETLTGHQLREAVAHGDGVRLTLDGPGRTTLDVDHVIAGTGFRVDISRLGFLPDGLRSGIDTVNRYPVLTRDGESSVAGLYFAGAPAAVSLGPSTRFIAGTHTTVPHLTRSIAARARSGSRRPALATARG